MSLFGLNTNIPRIPIDRRAPPANSEVSSLLPRAESPASSDAEDAGAEGTPSPHPTIVLLAVHVKGEPDVSEILACMSDGGAGGIQAAQVEGVYKSTRQGVLVLVSVPIAVWHLLPDHGGCRFVAFIEGGNLLMASEGGEGGIMEITADDGISYPGNREEAIRTGIPIDNERLNEPPPPPPYSQRDVLTME